MLLLLRDDGTLACLCALLATCLPCLLMLFTCPSCQEFVGNTHCKASGSNTKRLVLKVGQWNLLGSYNWFRVIYYIYVRLDTPEQCASASNANEVTLKEGKSCVLLDKRCACWPCWPLLSADAITPACCGCAGLCSFPVT